MTRLEAGTWWRFAIWMALGLAIYVVYGMRNSRLRKGEVTNPEAQI